VERVTLLGVSIRKSEVDGHCKVKFTPTKDIVQKTVALLEVKFCKLKSSSILLGKAKLYLSVFFKLLNSEKSLPKVFMPPTFLRLEKLHFDIQFLISIAKVGYQYRKLVELKLGWSTPPPTVGFYL
jgi:hypothetical protein